jgi:hypothetical protein
MGKEVKKKMKKWLMIAGLTFSLFLLISSAVAVPTVQYNQQKKVIVPDEESNSFTEKIMVLFELRETQNKDSRSFLENLSSFFANVSLRFQVLFIVLFKWPMQGLRNIYNFAFVEHQFVRSALSLIFQENSDDFTFKEKLIIAFTLFVRWPIQALINVFTYAFVENSFFSSLFNELRLLSIS